jgi:hypothetical protein
MLSEFLLNHSSFWNIMQYRNFEQKTCIERQQRLEKIADSDNLQRLGQHPDWLKLNAHNLRIDLFATGLNINVEASSSFREYKPTWIAYFQVESRRWLNGNTGLSNLEGSRIDSHSCKWDFNIESGRHVRSFCFFQVLHVRLPSEPDNSQRYWATFNLMKSHMYMAPALAPAPTLT